MAKMRIVRGAAALSDYLEKSGCPMSEATIYRLLKTYDIPFHRPSPGILVFSLDAIDSWLIGGMTAAMQEQVDVYTFKN